MRHLSLRTRLLAPLLTCLFVIALAAPSFAHRVTIFAWEEDGVIHTESTFSGGKKARRSTVTVSNAKTGETLLTGTTDDAGLFSFPVPPQAAKQRMDLRLKLNAGTGHAGEWVIAADEYLGAKDWQEVAPSTPITDAEPAPVAPGGHNSHLSVSEAALERIVERAVDRKLAPIAKRLAAQETSGPSMADIFGGIGYIFGLFGVGALVASRKRS
ncbi:hypothetical protein ACI3L3_07915 [Desulfobaculum sp. SPO524]|uniref:hypothetical protein n=1 Tax=Desulfobaculum sp. SPO524 TaxID=3378071 RepID=UPI0038537D78